ncbi:MAG: phosphohydrolase [Gammaproteobacteria bacterium]|nr:phosphohydrolase [Gammaproteobacteria bacterium]
MAKTLCIYHGNCDDGFGAAYAVWKKYGDDAEFFEARNRIPPSVDDHDVIIVDFCYPRAVMLDIVERANSVLLLDHHKTSHDEVGDLVSDGTIAGAFDMSRSGAMMAWQYFHPDKPVPKAITHLHDSDLGLFDLPNTRRYILALRSHPRVFEDWDAIMGNPQKLLQEGEVIRRYHDLQVDEIIRFSRLADLNGHSVRVANASRAFAGDVAWRLSEDNLFGVCYWHSPHGVRYSLRSDGNFDVSEVAKHFDGGGHVNSAAFTADVIVHTLLAEDPAADSVDQEARI